jgi:hypothetical protein
MEVRRLRVDVEKSRKELKADALEFGRRVDAEAKRITEMIVPIENHLQEQEDIVAKELERRRKEQEAQEAKALQDRLDRLGLIGVLANPTLIRSMSDSDFADYLKAKTEQFEAEEKRKADEIARMESEREQLRIEREKIEAEQARIRAEQEKQQDKIREEQEAIRKQQEAEQARLHREREEHQEAVRSEQLRLERERQRLERLEFERQASERAAKEAEERIERERVDAELERQRQERLQPDRKKISAWITRVTAVEVPEIADAELKDIVLQCDKAIQNALGKLRKSINGVQDASTKQA